jgi:transcriptional regulator with XRE-family HTH domain
MVTSNSKHKTSSTHLSQRRDQALGQFFRNRRIEAGLTLDQVSKELEIPTETLLQYENGAQTVPCDDIFTLANGLNIPPEDLLTEIHNLYNRLDRERSS